MAQVYYDVKPSRVKRRDLKEMREGVADTLNMMTRYALVQNAVSKLRWKRPRLILPRPEPVQPDEYIYVEIPVALWVLALLLFGIAESLTAVLALDVTGASIWANIFVKTIIMVVLFLIGYYSMWRYGWIIPLVLCVIGTCLTLNNLIIYYSVA
jgi:hypothetical protein